MNIHLQKGQNYILRQLILIAEKIVAYNNPNV